MKHSSKVPSGRFARLGRMLRVGSRAGLDVLRGHDGQAGAEQAALLLGELRGLAAKVGQMAGYVDGFLPEAQAGTYGPMLAKLQAQAPTSPFDTVRAQLEQELEAPLSGRFAHFDETPIASASIGQVHRARLLDGRQVAVKVQHPGIAEAMENDLRSGGAIADLVGTVGPKAVNAKELYREIAARFRDELDYRKEAAFQQRFRALHESDADVHVPEIIASHTTAKVLTSEFVDALSYEQAIAQAEPLRRKYVEGLWRFVFRSMLEGSMFNADPHPGNYLFHVDGRVTYLDFGCVQEVSETYRQAALGMHRAALARDRASFADAARRGLGTRAGDYESAMIDYLWRGFAPLQGSPFNMRREYVASRVRDIQELKRYMFKRDANVTPLPPNLALLNRLQFGFFSVLARFDVAANYAGVDRLLVESLGTSEGVSASQ